MDAFLSRKAANVIVRDRAPAMARPTAVGAWYASSVLPERGGSLAFCQSNAKMNKEQMHCWEGYERVPGTKAGEKGSCRPKGSGKPRKRRKKESGSGSESYSSSESESEKSHKKESK